MKNKNELGFGIIEVIIAMAIVAIIGKVAYSSYQESLIRANEENAKHKLVNLMQEMEKYYATHGAYSATSGAWPAAVSQKIASLNANSKEPYTYTVFPLEPAGNNQATCINASPKSNTIQDNNSQLLIDEQNNIAVNSVIPTKCLAVLVPPVVNPVINACFNADGSQKPFSSDGDGCNVDNTTHTGSGNCDGKTLSACSGNCNGANVCGPTTTGCSGNCRNAFIYNSPCSGNCDNSVIYLVSSGATVGAACAGNCKGVSIIVPSSWAARELSCAEKSQDLCVCKGNGNNCSGITVTFY
jgi:type IV pilus assembly protein PilE